METSGDARHSDCYPEFNWIRTWMNSTTTKMALGIDPSLSFELDNIRVKLAFHGRGDSVRNSAGLLPELIANGIRLLVYAGVTGMSNRLLLQTISHYDSLLLRSRLQLHGTRGLPWRTVSF